MLKNQVLDSVSYQIQLTIHHKFHNFSYDFEKTYHHIVICFNVEIKKFIIDEALTGFGIKINFS